jgi:hypothetical protein
MSHEDRLYIMQWIPELPWYVQKNFPHTHVTMDGWLWQPTRSTRKSFEEHISRLVHLTLSKCVALHQWNTDFFDAKQNFENRIKCEKYDELQPEIKYLDNDRRKQYTLIKFHEENTSLQVVCPGITEYRKSANIWNRDLHQYRPRIYRDFRYVPHLTLHSSAHNTQNLLIDQLLSTSLSAGKILIHSLEDHREIYNQTIIELSWLPLIHGTLEESHNNTVFEF